MVPLRTVWLLTAVGEDGLPRRGADPWTGPTHTATPPSPFIGTAVCSGEEVGAVGGMGGIFPPHLVRIPYRQISPLGKCSC